MWIPHVYIDVVPPPPTTDKHKLERYMKGVAREVERYLKLAQKIDTLTPIEVAHAYIDVVPPPPKPVEKEIVQKHEEIGRMLGEVARGLANILEHEPERGAHSALKRLEESIERAIQKVERGHQHGIALPAPRTTTMHGFSMGHGGHIPGGVFKHFDTQIHEILNSIASEFENKIMGLVTNWNKHPGLDIGDMVVFLRKANELKKQYLNNVPPALRGQLEKLLNEKINKVARMAMSVLI